MNSASEPFYHVTVLSNFARAFDKYRRQYRKSAIPESRYPNEFYLLPIDQIGVGVTKASRLRDRTEVAGNQLLALQADLPIGSLKPNLRSGIGKVWPSPDLPVARLFRIEGNGTLGTQVSIEDAMAGSLALHARSWTPFESIRPRSVSFLPIARGCQAACPFCFSEASASFDQRQGRLDSEEVRQWVTLAHTAGAERAVITGGGEPTLLPHKDLLGLIRSCGERFKKVVLITNGVQLATAAPSVARARLRDMHRAGLTVLAVSRHHPAESVNANLMSLATRTSELLRVRAEMRELLPGQRTRLVCVLQKGGVASVADVQEYVAWAASFGVDEVCFKELYVSTSRESVYYSRQANEWSEKNQVPLSIVHEWAEEEHFGVSARLPWGAPIFSGMVAGRSIRVAAYTEPSVYWERSNRLARSWNVMADGTCLASLEDRASLINLRSNQASHSPARAAIP
jgi:molybdenum cofactor biosynthesis enzyme MoaA